MLNRNLVANSQTPSNARYHYYNLECLGTCPFTASLNFNSCCTNADAVVIQTTPMQMRGIAYIFNGAIKSNCSHAYTT